MKKIHKSQSIYVKLLIMIIIPMLAMGIIITISASGAFNESMCDEVSVELKNTADTVVSAYDIMYPGDYKMIGTGEVAIVKGEKVISNHTDLLDRIKEKSGLEVSVFYYNTRISTTIEDSDGNRLTGTVANSKVEKAVIKEKNEQFYNNAVINGKEYYAYYVPLYNSDETCVGMVSVAKEAKLVRREIRQALEPIIIIAVGVMMIAVIISSLYFKKIISVLNSIRKYLNKVSAGNLNEDIDLNVSSRDDELGEIGHSILTMKNSLKEMVEIDALTGINNRRCGENRLKETIKQAEINGMPFSIALGDIDYFKKVNDGYGHDCGDEVLKVIALILKQGLVGKGYAIRWGGEEFLLVYDKVNYDEAVVSLEKIVKNIENTTVDYDTQKVNVTMTFGIVEGRTDIELHHQIKDADDKLYQGKMQGRNRIIG